MKKRLFLFVVLLIILELSVGAYTFNHNDIFKKILHASDGAYTFGKVSVKINGKLMLSESQPIIIKDTTLVPVRPVADQLGCGVSWNSENMTVNIEKESNRIVFQIGSPDVTVNGVKKKLSAEALLVGGTAYVPMRALSELVGAKVGWDASSSTAGIFLRNKKYSLTVGDYYCEIGETTDDLVSFCGAPSYTMLGDGGLTWYIYSYYYPALMAVATDGGIVCGFYTDSQYFSTSDGNSYGTPVAASDKEYETLKKEEVTVNKFNDKAAGILYGIMYMADGYYNEHNIDESLKNQSRLGIDILNSFRYQYGVKVVYCDPSAAAASSAHAEYMVKNEVLTHTGADGSSGIQRYLVYNPGYKWSSWAENICAGAKNIFICMNGWRNSARHREIILSDKTYAGIGMAYSAESRYKYAATMLILK